MVFSVKNNNRKKINKIGRESLINQSRIKYNWAYISVGENIQLSVIQFIGKLSTLILIDDTKSMRIILIPFYCSKIIKFK